MNDPSRINADVQQARHGTNIHIPVETGKIQTVVTIILEENGAVKVAGPLNKPSLMVGLLTRARAIVDQYQRTRLVQPVNGVVHPDVDQHEVATHTARRQ